MAVFSKGYGYWCRPRPQTIPHCPLNGRELEILAPITAGLKTQEFADQRFISLKPVLYHNKNIYGKLGVSKRTQAAAKAQEPYLI